MRTIALASLLIACGSSASPPAPPAKAPVPAKRPGLEADCKAAFAETPPPDMTPEQRARWDALDPMRLALTHLCVEDEWSVAATDCLAKAPPGGAGDCLDKHLTPQQAKHAWHTVSEVQKRGR